MATHVPMMFFPFLACPQKHFQETVTPAVRESLSLYPACLDRKNNVMQQLEKQLAGGLNHALDSIEEWVKHVLSRVRCIGGCISSNPSVFVACFRLKK